MSSPGESVRETYRLQGQERERERIIALINQLEEVSFVSDADQDYIIGDALDLIELIKGEPNG